MEIILKVDPSELFHGYCNESDLMSIVKNSIRIGGESFSWDVILYVLDKLIKDQEKELEDYIATQLEFHFGEGPANFIEDSVVEEAQTYLDATYKVRDLAQLVKKGVPQNVL